MLESAYSMYVDSLSTSSRPHFTPKFYPCFLNCVEIVLVRTTLLSSCIFKDKQVAQHQPLLNGYRCSLSFQHIMRVDEAMD